jgi:Protein of unknown function (DUF992)
MFRISVSLAFAALVLSASSAVAQSRVEIGVLSCRGPTESYIIASMSNLNCVFRRHDGQTFRYAATVRRFGIDIGINQMTALEWAVYAPTRRIAPNDLRGNYAGVSAGASVGAGLGANVLLGGSNDTIALQPVSVQGQTGLGVEVTVAGLTLQ